MINKLRIAIAKGIESIKQNPDIYLDKLPQGFNAPCFFIRVFSVTDRQKLFKNYEITVSFDVMYYPDETMHCTNRQLHEVARELMYGIEYLYVDADTIIRGNNISYEVQDSVLHFFISYKYIESRPFIRNDKMQKLYQNFSYKE